MFWIITYRRYLLAFIIVVTAVFAYSMKDIHINFSFDSFYPKTDAEYIYFQKYKETFHEKQDLFISIAVKAPGKDIFDADFLARTDSLFAKISRIKGVDSVISGTRFSQIKRSGMGVKNIPYLQFETQEEAEASRTRVLQDSFTIGTFITPDLHYLSGHIFIEPAFVDSTARDDISNGIDKAIEESKLETIVTGVPYIRSQYVSKIQNEVLLFVSIAMLLLVIILTITFRNAWCVVIPLGTVFVGCIWTFGLMALTGQAVNLVTNLLIPIVFVVGVSDIIHITTKYLSELKEGHAPRAAMGLTLQEIGFATFLTCITTAIGFASLSITDVPPLKVFGLYGCFGVVGTYVISVVLIPNILLIIPPHQLIKAKSLENSEKWDPFLLKILHTSLYQPLKVVMVTAGVLGLSLYFTYQIPTNMHLLEDLSWRDPVRKSMVFFEEKLFGVRPFEMGIHLKNGHTVKEREVLVELEKIQNYLDSRTDFGLFLSPVSFVKTANYVQHFNQKAHLKLPDTQTEIDEIFDIAEVEDQNGILQNIVAKEYTLTRISARTPDLGADVHKKIRDDLELYMKNNCNLQLFDYHFTGHGFLTEHNLVYLRESLLEGLIVDFLTIGLLMGLLFKSFRMMLISMLPNMIPLLVTSGIMGIFGITLTTTSAVVFVVVFGIAVDDTIHFLTHYKLERQKGLDKIEALTATTKGSGKAIILTSVVLLSGFFTLLSSSFGGTFNIGLFSLITIVFAVISDLYLTPLLVKHFGD